MTNEEILKKIQAAADENSKKYVRSTKLTLIHTETLADGTIEAYCLGDDMPLLIYRIFNIAYDTGAVTEITDLQTAADKTRHYNVDVKPTLKLVPPEIEENLEYEIVVENPLPNHGVEVKLKSSIGRDVTMIEVYRYFDYVSRIFFVSCIGLSFGGQYLFSVTPDSKKLKLIVGNNADLRKRVDMMTELLQAHLLPSYKTISAAAQLLNGQVKAQIDLDDGKGNKTKFESTFVYDDAETETRYAFFANAADQKQGIILVQDIFDNNRLVMSNAWRDDQKAAVERFKADMKNNPDEFNKHCTSFFADDLDFRYKAFKDGKLKPAAETAPAAPEAPEAK